MVHYPNRKNTKNTEARNRDYYKFGDKRYIIQITNLVHDPNRKNTKNTNARNRDYYKFG